ncbi:MULTISPECIES: hypothetical protein [Haloarcula]|uniref:hypothetical protein n=1 Tax=Haloarcula TaxID=2237 RepID=UPI0023E7F64B|nr:hypothetical protein [Halomicroarcula sp. SHR3]
MDAQELLQSPYTAVAVIGSALGSIGYLPLDLWTIIIDTSGLWFPAIATMASTILPEFGYESLGTQLLVAGAIVYVAVLLYRMYGRIKNWSENR